MAKASKQKSLTALAKSLDTRKQPLPSKKLDGAQRRVLERAVRPEVRPRIEAALARQPLASGRSSSGGIAGKLAAKAAPPVTSRAKPSSPRAPVKSASGSRSETRPASVATTPSSSSSSRPLPSQSVRSVTQASSPAARSVASAPLRPAAPPARVDVAPSRAPVPFSSTMRGPATATALPSSSTSRASALSSLQRSPTPAPSRLPEKKVTAPAALAAGDARRRYPRAEVHVRASLALADDPSRVFEASLPTVNLSVGGLFLESSFFLKPGTRLLVTLQLPRQGREVKVKGEVVRVESNGAGPSGFALRFTEYLDGSQVVLATHFLSPVLKEFLSQYAKEHRFEASPEYLAHTADVLAAWELKKAELGGDVWALFSSGE